MPPTFSNKTTDYLMSVIRYQTPSLASTFSPLARLSAFQHEVDRFFGLPLLGRETTRSAGWTPALDLHQDKDSLFVHAELPGMKKEDVTLSLHDGVLTLSGERRHVQGDKTTLRNERSFGRFERSITLPAPVDATRVTAAYENGILTVTLPKAEAAKPRQIEINVK